MVKYTHCLLCVALYAVLLRAWMTISGGFESGDFWLKDGLRKSMSLKWKGTGGLHYLIFDLIKNFKI